jgi:hypothetical protein
LTEAALTFVPVEQRGSRIPLVEVGGRKSIGTVSAVHMELCVKIRPKRSENVEKSSV